MERIQYLKSEKLRQEDAIKRSFKDLVQNFDLLSMIRGPVKERTEDRSILKRVVRVGFSTLSRFLINMFMGKRRDFKTFLKSLLLQEFSALMLGFDFSRAVSVVSGFLRQYSEARETKNKN